MTEAARGASVVVLARDLLVSSRIISIARRLGVSARQVRDPSILNTFPAAPLLIVDLDQEGALAAALDWRRQTSSPVAGFVQHVNTERIREAHQAGIEPIVPRSRLEKVIPELLAPFGGQSGSSATASG